MTKEIEQWMPEARQIAAQCWCDDETSGRVMDPVLCESVARRIAAWMATAAQESRNAEFYRGLVDACASHLGPKAYTADDGVVHQDPIRLKVPELVAELARLRGEVGDDGEPVTEEWLRSVGFATSPNPIYVRVNNGTLAVAFHLGNMRSVELFDCDSHEMVNVKIKDRGHVRRLCAALGIPLATGGEGV